MPKKAKTKKSAIKFIKTGHLKFDATFMLVTAAVVIVTSGYLFYQSIHAAVFPPSRYYSSNVRLPIKNVRADDQFIGDVYCPPYKIRRLGYTSSICVQVRFDGTRMGFRMGYYNFGTKRFNNLPGWGWLPDSPQSKLLADLQGAHLGICSDGRVFITNLSNVWTPNYGPTSYGAIITRRTSTQWQARSAIMNTGKQSCAYVSGSVAYPIIN